jgi:hypothetical protein
VLRAMTRSTQLSRIIRRHDGVLNYLSSIHHGCTLGGRCFVTSIVLYRRRGDRSTALALYSSVSDRGEGVSSYVIHPRFPNGSLSTCG